MIIKTIGIMTVFLSSAAIGFGVSEGFCARQKELINLADSIELMQGELGYSFSPVREVIKRVCPNVKGACHGFFSSMVNMMENSLSPPRAWEKAIEQNADDMCLTQSDKNILISSSYLLSAYEIEEQQSHLSELKNRALKLAREAEQSKNKNTKLVRMLGVYGGALICVLLF